MNVIAAFARLFFLLISVLLITAYTTKGLNEITLTNIFSGIALGSVFSLFLIGLDTLLKRCNLRAFNTVVLGLFFGYAMGLALFFLFDAVLNITDLALDKVVRNLAVLGIFLFGVYQGLMMTIRASEEIYISLPFFRFKPMSQKKKDLLLDSSVLSDPRLIDFASSGILDKHLIVPRFIVKELYENLDRGDESLKAKSRKSLDVLKKLEGIPSLELAFNETDFSDAKEIMEKLVRLGRLLDANVLSADINRIQVALVEGVRIINIHSLSNALKPIMQAGEYIKIKVQRHGKEAKQGVGYLDDGTMVVINGGGDFIGEVLKAQVLSVKHTSSGRMVFCNASELDRLYSASMEEDSEIREDFIPVS